MWSAKQHFIAEQSSCCLRFRVIPAATPLSWTSSFLALLQDSVDPASGYAIQCPASFDTLVLTQNNADYAVHAKQKSKRSTARLANMGFVSHTLQHTQHGLRKCVGVSNVSNTQTDRHTVPSPPAIRQTHCEPNSTCSAHCVCACMCAWSHSCITSALHSCECKCNSDARTVASASINLFLQLHGVFKRPVAQVN